MDSCNWSVFPHNWFFFHVIVHKIHIVFPSMIYYKHIIKIFLYVNIFCCTNSISAKSSLQRKLHTVCTLAHYLEKKWKSCLKKFSYSMPTFNFVHSIKYKHYQLTYTLFCIRKITLEIIRKAENYIVSVFRIDTFKIIPLVSFYINAIKKSET
jgi:hypothetical protein